MKNSRRPLNLMMTPYMERGSSVVECRTRNQVSPGSNPSPVFVHFSLLPGGAGIPISIRNCSHHNNLGHRSRCSAALADLQRGLTSEFPSPRCFV